MTQKATSSNVSWQDLGIITCSVCNLKTSDQGLFQAHNCKPRKSLKAPPLTKANITYSNTTKKFSCSICKLSINEQQIEDHIENHITPNPYMCYYCKLPFDSQLKVFQHCSCQHSTEEPLHVLNVSSKTKDIIRKAKLKGTEFYVPLNFNVLDRKSVRSLTKENKGTTSSCNLVSESLNHSENLQPLAFNPPVRSPSGCNSQTLQLPTKSNVLAPESVKVTSTDKVILHKSIPFINLTSWTSFINASTGAMEKSNTCIPISVSQNVNFLTCIDRTTQTLNSDVRISHPNEGGADCPVVSMKLPVQILPASEKESTLIKDNRNLDENNENASSWESVGNHSVNEHSSHPTLPIGNFCGLSSSDSVIQASFLNGHDYLRVVKGYFLCLKCKMKWSSDYDSFFKHIWTYHVHGEDFSCCPDGYSVKCLLLKTVLKSVYDKSQESMSDIIKSYLQFDSVIEEIDTINNADSNEIASISVTNHSVSPSLPTDACSVTPSLPIVSYSATSSLTTVACSNLPSAPTVVSTSDNRTEEINKNKGSHLLQDGFNSDFPQQRLQTENQMLNSHSNRQHLLGPDSSCRNRLNSLKEAEEFYQCGQLNCTFASVQPVDLLLHSEESHGAENKFPCVYCGLKTNSISILLDHMNQHIGTDKGFVFSCSVLHSTHVVDRFETQDLKHILSRFEEILKLNDKSNLHFVCNTCETEFDSLEELKEHLQKFLLKVIRCKHCRSYFLKTSSWQKHREMKHPNEPRLYCINRKLLCDASKRNVSQFGQLSENNFNPHVELVSNNDTLETINSPTKAKVDKDNKLLYQPYIIQIEGSNLQETRSPLTSETSSFDDVSNTTNNNEQILHSENQLENCGVTQTSSLTIETEVTESNNSLLNHSEYLDDVATLNNEPLSEGTSKKNKLSVSKESCVTESLTSTTKILSHRINSVASEKLAEIITADKSNCSKEVHACEQINRTAIVDAGKSEGEILPISAEQAYHKNISDIPEGLDTTEACITFESLNMGEGSGHVHGSKDLDSKSCTSNSPDYNRQESYVTLKIESSKSTDSCVAKVSDKTEAKSLLNECLTPMKPHRELNHHNHHNQSMNSLELMENEIECAVSPALEHTNAVDINDDVALDETMNQKELNTKIIPAEIHKTCKRSLQPICNKKDPPVKKFKKSNSLPNSLQVNDVLSLADRPDENLNVNIPSVGNKISEEKKTNNLKTGLQAGLKRKTINKYSCIHDGCSFVSRWHKKSMSNHVRTKHPYCCCGYCGAIYFFRNHLFNHLKFAHRGMEPNINYDVPLEKLFKVFEMQGGSNDSSNDSYFRNQANIKGADNVSVDIKNNEVNTVIEKNIEYSNVFNEKNAKSKGNSNDKNLKHIAKDKMHSTELNNPSKNMKSQPHSDADKSLKVSSSAQHVKESSTNVESSDTFTKPEKRKKQDHSSANKNSKLSKQNYKSSLKSSKTPSELLATKQNSCEHVDANSKDSAKTSGNVIDLFEASQQLLPAQVKKDQTFDSRKKNVVPNINKKNSVDKTEIMSLEEYPFQCDVCKLGFKSINDVEKHFKALHPGEVETYVFIDRATSSTYAITGELLNSKPGMRPNLSHLCKYCSFRKESSSEVEEHIRHAHPQNDLKVILLGVARTPQETCNKESKTHLNTDNFSTTSNVVKVPSTSSLVYNCNKCGDQLGSEFLFRFHLAQHGGFKHTNVLTTTTGLLVCSICGYFASSNHDLGQHTGIHLNERRYKCSLCDFDGHNKPSVNYHLSTAHYGVDGIEIIDRNKRSRMHLQPTLVNMQPRVELKNALLYADYLSELLIKNGIKNIELNSDVCAHIFKHNSDQYFDVVAVNESE